MATVRTRSGVIVLLSVLLAGLIAFASTVGVYTPEFYVRESFTWQVQSVGQDVINLVLIVPFLLITSLLTFLNKEKGIPLWGGVVLYIIYTFTIYCFSVHFNILFIVYCIILGLSFYSFIYFLLILLNERSRWQYSNTTFLKSTGIYFVVLAVAFYLLWLSEIVPAIVRGTPPQSLVDAGLATNPVHVIDLSVFLPGVFITGYWLLKKSKVAAMLAPVILVFFILMDITIISLSVIMVQSNAGGSYSVAIGMGVLTLISTAMLTWYLYGNTSE